MTMLLKCADISHAAKSWSLHQRWTDRCQQEFASQLEKEKQMGLPISMAVEDTKAGIASSQIGFIKFVVLPLFNPLATFFGDEAFSGRVDANLQQWVQKLAEANAGK